MTVRRGSACGTLAFFVASAAIAQVNISDILCRSATINKIQRIQHNRYYLSTMERRVDRDRR